MPRHILPVALFTLAYTGAFTLWFLSIGNREFVLYVLTMAGVIAVVGLTLAKADYPLPMLWALSLWGLMHMAGGGVPVAGSCSTTCRFCRCSRSAAA